MRHLPSAPTGRCLTAQEIADIIVPPLERFVQLWHRAHPRDAVMATPRQQQAALLSAPFMEAPAYVRRQRVARRNRQGNYVAPKPFLARSESVGTIAHARPRAHVKLTTSTVADMAACGALSEAAIHGTDPTDDVAAAKQLVLAARGTEGWKHFLRCAKGETLQHHVQEHTHVCVYVNV